MSCNDTPAELQGAVLNIASPLSPTEFKCIDTKGEIVILDSKEVPGGTLIGYGDSNYYKREAFRVQRG